MLQITEVNIFSLSKDEDAWTIEGEIIFEDDLTSAFEADYLPDEDELENLSLELELDGFDTKVLKNMILDAANDYEDCYGRRASMSLTICPAYDRPEEVKALFLEYTDFLLKADPSFAAFLELQNYDRELDHLEEKYGMPKGRLYLALVDDAIAGCIALRPLSDTECELKRLYVKDAFRGQGIAEHLVEKLIDDAREMGYDAMLLDTLPFLKGALHLYAKLGFQEIPPYNNSPMETSIFLKLDLHQ